MHVVEDKPGDKDNGDIFLEADDDVRRYRQMFDYLRAGALSPTDSAKLISSVVEGSK